MIDDTSRTGAHLWTYDTGEPVIRSSGLSTVSSDTRTHPASRSTFDGKKSSILQSPVVIPGMDGQVVVVIPGRGAHVLDIKAMIGVSSPLTSAFSGTDTVLLVSRESSLHAINPWNGVNHYYSSSSQDASRSCPLGTSPKGHCSNMGRPQWDSDSGAFSEALLLSRSDYTVKCVNKMTGLAVWNFTVSEVDFDLHSMYQERSSGDITGGQITSHQSESQNDYPHQMVSTVDGVLRAVERSSGLQVWQADLSSPAMALYTWRGTQ